MVNSYYILRPGELRIEHQPHFHCEKQFEMHFLDDHRPHKPELSCIQRNTKTKCGFSVVQVNLENDEEKKQAILFALGF